MTYRYAIGISIIACLWFSNIGNLAYSLTESVDLFGQINSVDLVLNDVWIEPENPKRGDAITIHGSLYNAGIIPTKEVSNAVTIGYVVNGELAEIALLDNVEPGIKKGIEISSTPIFDVTTGNILVTVIVNYHDTLSHLRDNPRNNIVQKIFYVDTVPSLITSDIYQQYDSKKNKKKIRIEGELTNIFQKRLENNEVTIEINGDIEKAITDSEGKFIVEKKIPFKNEMIRVITSLKNDLAFFNPPQTIFPIKLDRNESALSLEIKSEQQNRYLQEQKLTIVLFQDSYENLFREISLDQTISQNPPKNDFFIELPADHEYIAEIYLEGRFLHAFQQILPANKVIEREVPIPDSAQVRFRVTDESGEPQSNVTVNNWIYSGITDENGLTDWIDVLPTILEKEPYIANAIMPDGNIIWSEPFLLKTGEKKVITINTRE